MTAVATIAPTRTAAAAGTLPAVLPGWLQEIERLRAARAAHFFLVHGNVEDYVFDGARPPYRLPAYLLQHLQRAGYQRIGVLSLSAGLAWVTPAGGAGGPEMRASGDGSPADLLGSLRQLEFDLHRAGTTRTAVILEYLDHLAPHTTSMPDREAMRAIEMLTRIAVDDGLRGANIALVGLTHSLEAVAPAFSEAVGGVAPVAAPLPSTDERRRFLDYLASPEYAAGVAPLEDGLSLETLAHLTQGVTLAGLEALNRAARVADAPITYAMVRDHKRDAIERQSRGVLEEVEARYGFDAVGGLQYVIDYLRTVVAHLRARRLEAVPKGILLAGAPGTGKTLVAEALAKEAGCNFIRLGDVRSKWIGESERNLSRALQLLVDLEPVVVFVDEVDQMLGIRDRGWNGDSGVSARIFGRILNFMGKNEHRGRVLWIAATNRPDLLDEAMVRRFDRVLPFFVPAAGERARILQVLPKITGAAYAPDLPLDQVVAGTDGLTGSALEVIVRRAAELAGDRPIGEAELLMAVDDYKPNHDPATYEYQSLLALQATNLFSSLPAREEMPESVRALVDAMRREGRATPLLDRLRALRPSCRGL